MRLLPAATATLLIVMSAACSPGAEEVRPEVTRRQKDSIVGASGLPGSSGVTKLLRATDSIQARSDRLDSLSEAVSRRK